MPEFIVNFPHKIGCNFCHIRSLCDMLQMILASYRKVHVSAGDFCSTISLGRGKFRCLHFFPSPLLFLLCERWQHAAFYHFIISYQRLLLFPSNSLPPVSFYVCTVFINNAPGGSTVLCWIRIQVCVARISVYLFLYFYDYCPLIIVPTA